MLPDPDYVALGYCKYHVNSIARVDYNTAKANCLRFGAEIASAAPESVSHFLQSKLSPGNVLKGLYVYTDGKIDEQL